MSRMSEFGGDHAQISAAFLLRSREYLASGSLLQASEKGWGAAAHSAKMFAKKRDGLEYARHEQFRDVVLEIRLEAKDDRIPQWVKSAEDLHGNFYSDEFDVQKIADCLDDVANFVNLIRQLVGLPPVDD